MYAHIWKWELKYLCVPGRINRYYWCNWSLRQIRTYELCKVLEAKGVKRIWVISALFQINGEWINIDMHRLMRLGKGNFPQFDDENPKYFHICFAVFAWIVILFNNYKFQHLIMFCCKRSRRVEESRPHEVREASAPVLERAIVYVPDVGVKFNHV